MSGQQQRDAVLVVLGVECRGAWLIGSFLSKECKAVAGKGVSGTIELCGRWWAKEGGLNEPVCC